MIVQAELENKRGVMLSVEDQDLIEYASKDIIYINSSTDVYSAPCRFKSCDMSHPCMEQFWSHLYMAQLICN